MPLFKRLSYFKDHKGQAGLLAFGLFLLLPLPYYQPQVYCKPNALNCPSKGLHFGKPIALRIYLTATQEPPETPKQMVQDSTYRNSTLGFSLQLPAGWIVEPEHTYIGSTNSQIVFSNNRYELDSAGLKRELADNVGLTIRVFADPKVATASASQICPPETDSALLLKNITIGGMPTKLITLPLQATGSATSQPATDHACVEHNGKLYSFWAGSGNSASWVEQKPQVEQVLHSFKFEN